ncbi:MAG: PIG-L family deacetylase, partial [Aquaticitalea sp.]
MLKRYSLLILTLLFCISTKAQQPKKPNSSDIYESIKKLNFLGSVLYIAAHPDDENTRLISYMANEVKARTGYLSLTRGDGGQNLVGPEIRELLGVIRTQELLAARRIDGGEQRFTRANDFGYSKDPEETLAIWNKDEVLGDVVWTIRNFQPDVIINRFDHRTGGTTHGHHTSSAILSVEAFDLAGKKSAYPDQLKYTTTWQPKRQFFNTSWWFYGSQEKFDKADKTNLMSFDVGTYFPSKGLSNSEIAALSRSSHKSQGFGNTGSRGSETEYVELINGDLPIDKSNLFDGIDTSWNRVNGGQPIGAILKNVQDTYDFKNPSTSITKLMEAYKLIDNLPDQHWKTIKLEDVKNVIAACAGLYLEAVANSNTATPNSKVPVKLEAINRSNQDIILKSVLFSDGSNIEKNTALKQNEDQGFEADFSISANATYSSPYWLIDKGTLGMYKVNDQQMIGLPETAQINTATFNMAIAGESISFTKPIVYKTNDAVKGEVYKPFEIVPEVSAKVAEKVIIFATDQQKDISVNVKAGRNNLEGYVVLAHPQGWNVYPEQQKVNISSKGEEQVIVFTVIPPKDQSEG